MNQFAFTGRILAANSKVSAAGKTWWKVTIHSAPTDGKTKPATLNATMFKPNCPPEGTPVMACGRFGSWQPTTGDPKQDMIIDELFVIGSASGVGAGRPPSGPPPDRNHIPADAGYADTALEQATAAAAPEEQQPAAQAAPSQSLDGVPF